MLFWQSREEQEKEEEETSKSKKSQVQENAVLHFWNKENVVDLSDDGLSLLNVDEFSNAKETKVKVLISYPSGHVEVHSPED